MRLDRFIAQNRIIDIQSRELSDALRELIHTLDVPELKGYGEEKLLNQLLDRERTMTSYLGNGVALPHLRIPMKRRYVLAAGRVPGGLQHEGPNDYGEVRLVLLLIAAANVRGYLNPLAPIARVFHKTDAVENLLAAPSTNAFRDHLHLLLSGGQEKTTKAPSRINRLILREAERVARSLKAHSIFIFGDTIAGGFELGRGFDDINTVLVTRGSAENTNGGDAVNHVLPVRSFSYNRMSQLRSAVLIALTRGIIKPEGQIVCIGGLPQSNRFDTLLIVDVAREFNTLLKDQDLVLPSAIRPEVLERVLGIATELGMEGREGKPVGALFVLGDTNQVLEYTKPLVLNPFHGYAEEDRNVLNPFMDETVKEFSTIDGAFIIRGNGVIESAGTLLRPPQYSDSIPGGLGSRHASAAGITKSTRAIAITVSSSSGQVSLFSKGDLIPVVNRSFGTSF